MQTPFHDIKVSQNMPVTPWDILAKKIEDLCDRAFSNPQIDEAFLAELQFANQLANGLDAYTRQSSCKESDELSKLVLKTQSESWSDRYDDGKTSLKLEQEMLSGHIEGQFLKMLVCALRAKRILEIGLFTGYSALAMAEALPADGKLIACEIDDYAARFARSCFEQSVHNGKIEIEVGPAHGTMQRLADANDQFDFIFIDADKSGYISYFEMILDARLLAPHGLICVDNTLMQGQPYIGGKQSGNGAAITKFNKVVANDARVAQVLLPIRDGITLIRVV